MKFLHSLPLIRTLWHAISGTLLYLFHFENRAASTAFVKNQLSQSLISLSPLFTIHPRSLQRSLVRSSMSCYCHFNLIMNSSLRFGSPIWVFSSCFFSLFVFSLSSLFCLNFFSHIWKSLIHYTISIELVLFLPLPPRGCQLSSFILSLSVLLHYQSRILLRLSRWSCFLLLAFLLLTYSLGSSSFRSPLLGHSLLISSFWY